MEQLDPDLFLRSTYSMNTYVNNKNWDARSVPLYILARLYLIVRDDLDSYIQQVRKIPSIIIRGICNGKKFRPSDWAERLAGAATVFLKDVKYSKYSHYHPYSKYVVPAFINGVNCIIIDSYLYSNNRKAWDYVLDFATENNLEIKNINSLH